MSCVLPGIKKTPTLQARQVGDEVVLTWDHPRDYFDELSGKRLPLHRKFTYEVRRIGAPGYWTYAEEVTRTESRTLRTRHYGVGTQYYTVRTVAFDCVYATHPTEVQLVATHPAWHSTPVMRDETTASGGWPGTKLGTVDNAGSLELDTDEVSGTYTSPEINLDATALHRIGYIVTPRFETTKKNILETGTTIEDMTYPPTDERALRSSRELSPSADSVEAMERDAIDNMFCPASSWRLEVSVQESSGSPVWEDFIPGNYYGRYVQFRITLTREDADTDTIAIDGFTIDFSVVGSGSAGADAPSDWIDISLPPYNCTPDDSTPAVAAANRAAIQQAMDDAYGPRCGQFGRVVYIPTGQWYIDDQIVVKNWTRVIGADSRSSSIVLASTFPATGKAAFLMGIDGGTSADIVFGVRFENWSLSCSAIANTIGVYSNKAQEGCGLFNWTVNEFGDAGAVFETTPSPVDTSASIIVIDNIVMSTSIAGATGIRMTGVAGQNSIRNATINGGGGSIKLTDGILATGTNLLIENVHHETCVDGIDISGSFKIDGCYGHASVDNLIHVRSPSTNYSLHNITGLDSSPAGNNIFVDDNTGTPTNYPVADLSQIVIYTHGGPMIGNILLTRYAQTGSLVYRVYLPNLNEDRNLPTMETSEFVQTNHVVVGRGTGGGAVLKSAGAAGLVWVDANDNVQIHLKGAAHTGSDPSPYTVNLPYEALTAAINLVSRGSTDELRSKTLVAAVIKQNTAGTWPVLDAAGQSNAMNIARIPNLGASGGTYLFVMATLAQTLTKKTLTTPKIDQIDEETSGNGVAVDGLKVKDGNIYLDTVTVTTTSFTVTLEHRTLLLDCATASGNITLNLPTAVGNAGKDYWVYMEDSSLETYKGIIDPDGTETIGGGTTKDVIGDGVGYWFQSDGAKWIGYAT